MGSRGWSTRTMGRSPWGGARHIYHWQTERERELWERKESKRSDDRLQLLRERTRLIAFISAGVSKSKDRGRRLELELRRRQKMSKRQQRREQTENWSIMGRKRRLEGGLEIKWDALEGVLGHREWAKRSLSEWIVEKYAIEWRVLSSQAYLRTLQIANATA